MTRYCAPEMLPNPNTRPDEPIVEIVRASRKTDVYAYSILSWEILAQRKPFETVLDATFQSNLHNGVRPQLDLLPKDIPPRIIKLLENGWSADRAKRNTSLQIYNIIKQHNDVMEGKRFDIFFSHAWVNKPFLSQIYYELTKLNYRVWYDQNDIGSDIKESMDFGVKNSTIVIACINNTYQGRDNCMIELKTAVDAGKTVIKIVLEKDPVTWASNELKTLCDFKNMSVDMSELACKSLTDESDESTQINEQSNYLLRDMIAEKIIPLLNKNRCVPRYNSLK
jgi:hypothetical protein